jgi:hypothetical protein
VIGSTGCLGRVAEWQTRWLQVPVSFGTWGFKSPFAHRERFYELVAFVFVGVACCFLRCELRRRLSRANPHLGEERYGGNVRHRSMEIALPIRHLRERLGE